MSKNKIFNDEDWYNEKNQRKNRDRERRDNKKKKKDKEQSFIEEWNTEK